MTNTNNQILKNTNAEILDEFNASIIFDKELYSQDIQGSLAHAKMLFNQEILSKDEFNKIENGLIQVKNEIENKTFNFSLEYEDIHMAIESRLTEIIGEPGKKLHTARSRNDQVAVDFTLYVQHKTIEISEQLSTLISTFTNIASKHTHTLLPGMTHLQHAQPINFGYHLMAYANMFKRDYERFISSHKRNNYCPLGSAALAGTPHNINREQTAKDLGFSGPTLNAMDSVSNRDFALEILFNISTTMMHISRIAEELVQWSSYEFKFINISNEYATTSSIMPQKKNPDVPELLRGKTGRVFGNLFSLLTVMKGLPLAYNKDTQEDKEGVFDSVKTISISISILNEIIKTMKVNEDKMFKACQVGHLTATDFADYLVKYNNMPFRNAYYLTKDVVAYANKLNKDISQLSLEEIKASNENLKNINAEITTFLNLKNSMNSRNSLGGTSTKQTELQINFFKNWLKNNK